VRDSIYQDYVTSHVFIDFERKWNSGNGNSYNNFGDGDSSSSPFNRDSFGGLNNFSNSNFGSNSGNYSGNNDRNGSGSGGSNSGGSGNNFGMGNNSGNMNNGSNQNNNMSNMNNGPYSVHLRGEFDT